MYDHNVDLHQFKLQVLTEILSRTANFCDRITEADNPRMLLIELRLLSEYFSLTSETLAQGLVPQIDPQATRNSEDINRPVYLLLDIISVSIQLLKSAYRGNLETSSAEGLSNKVYALVSALRKSPPKGSNTSSEVIDRIINGNK